MPSTNMYRYAGLALLWGAVLAIIGNVLSSVFFPNPVPAPGGSALFAILTLASLIGQIFVLMGLPGIAVRQASEAGGLGLAGFVLTFVGGFLFTSFSVISLVIFPWLMQAAPNLLSTGPAPSLFTFFLIASILFGVGGLLLGIAVMRAGVLPRSAGLLLLVGAILNAAAFPLQGLLSTIVSTLAFVLFAAGIAWIGYELTAERRSMARVA